MLYSNGMNVTVIILLVTLPFWTAAFVTDGVCANNDACDKRCNKLYEMFLKENAKSNWNKRYPSISKILVDHKVNVSIEIGIARGGLSHFLLSQNKDLGQHHGVDPFLGKISVQQLRLSSSITPLFRSFHCSCL
jgi:hypothetical protein